MLTRKELLSLREKTPNTFTTNRGARVVFEQANAFIDLKEFIEGLKKPKIWPPRRRSWFQELSKPNQSTPKGAVMLSIKEIDKIPSQPYVGVLDIVITGYEFNALKRQAKAYVSLVEKIKNIDRKTILCPLNPNEIPPNKMQFANAEAQGHNNLLILTKSFIKE